MKYLATLSYLGEAYHGFERQPHQKTIQGTVERWLSRILGSETPIKGAGRTDAGVNATGQRFCFEARKIEDKGRFLHSLNRLLPEDIAVTDLKEVNDDFDARHSSIGKVYEYRFSTGAKDPMEKGRLTQLNRPGFDLATFIDAIRLFEGTHDFQNFTPKAEDVGAFVRTIESIAVKEEGNVVSVTFAGHHFMTYQIRLMMGAAFRAAYHSCSVEDVKQMLERRPRRVVSYKAPADGLYLRRVSYAEGF